MPKHLLPWSTNLTIRILTLLAALLCSSASLVAAEFYAPIERDVEGWTIEVDPQLLSGEHQDLGQQALKALANHLQRVTYIVPEERLAQLKTVRLRLDYSHPSLKAMQYHPGKQWLIDNGHDPRLVKRVHIPQAQNLISPQMWAKHPYVVLHELAHAYHDQFLQFDHPEIRATFEAAQDAGIYEDVLLYTGQNVRHYGLSNHKEYFAESTEAYFGVNDFYPFVRAELQQHDPRMFNLLQQIWGEVR
jgi:hypothetical protein